MCFFKIIFEAYKWPPTFIFFLWKRADCTFLNTGWNDIEESEWWQNIHFQVNYCFKWWVKCVFSSTATVMGKINIYVRLQEVRHFCCRQQVGSATCLLFLASYLTMRTIIFQYGNNTSTVDDVTVFVFPCFCSLMVKLIKLWNVIPSFLHVLWIFFFLTQPIIVII